MLVRFKIKKAGEDMKTAIYVLIFLLASASGAYAQTVQPDGTKNQTNYYPQVDSLQNTSKEITKISDL
jgi:hypothetical protein